MGKNRIVFAVTNDLNFDRRMSRICGSLSQNGYTITLVGRNLKKSLPLSDTAYKQRRLNCLFEKGKLFYIEYNIRLFFFLLFYKTDTVCSIDLDTIIPCYFVSKIRNKKMVFDAHEWFTEVPEVTNRRIVKWVWSLIEKIFVPKIKHAYTVGPILAKEFERRLGTHFEVIMNAPPFIEMPSPKTEKEKIILYQGALNLGRGIEKMILAMHHIDAVFWIVGEGDLSEKLRELTKDEGLDGKVIFKGFILPEDLIHITCRAWLGLNVSENAGLSYYYSLNNKYFDYIHAGLPSLINPFPEYLSLGEKYQTGIFVESDTEKLVKAVNSLLSQPKLYEELSENCVRAAKEFNWEKEEKKLLLFYENVGKK